MGACVLEPSILELLLWPKFEELKLEPLDTVVTLDQVSWQGHAFIQLNEQLG